jgi:hypothetical protein
MQFVWWPERVEGTASTEFTTTWGGDSVGSIHFFFPPAVPQPPSRVPGFRRVDDPRIPPSYQLRTAAPEAVAGQHGWGESPRRPASQVKRAKAWRPSRA